MNIWTCVFEASFWDQMVFLFTLGMASLPIDWLAGYVARHTWRKTKWYQGLGGRVQ